MKAIGQRIYGRADTFDPFSGYDGKAIPGAYHAVRSIMKDTLPTDDQVFPLIFSPNSDDRYAVSTAWTASMSTRRSCARAPGCIGTPRLSSTPPSASSTWSGPSPSATGAGTARWTSGCCPPLSTTRTGSTPRSTSARSWIAPSSSRCWTNIYRLRGWDPATGWPTRERLESLDLGQVYEPMVAGAEAAKAQLPELPPVGPVVDIHVDDPDRVAQKVD